MRRGLPFCFWSFQRPPRHRSGYPTAYSLAPPAYADSLIEQLGALRQAAYASGDIETAGALTLRIAETLTGLQKPGDALRWVEDALPHDPQNRVLLRKACELAELTFDYERASNRYHQLAFLEEGPGVSEIGLKLFALSDHVGNFVATRPVLERALQLDKKNVPLKDALRATYERMGDVTALAEMEFFDAAQATDPATKFASLLRGGAALLSYGQSIERAIEALEAAKEIKPNDLVVAAYLSDAYGQVGRGEDSLQVLKAVLLTMKGRRTKDLAPIHYRLALFARARNDHEAELSELSTALDMDAQNGTIAAHLATVAFEVGSLEIATKAFRALTMIKTPSPISRALAYQRLGEIALRQNDTQKAKLLLKRATDEDPTLETAKSLFHSLTGK